MLNEIFSDVYYRLNPTTYLFAILVDHVNEDEVTFTLQDFEIAKKKFMNCGIREVGDCFTKEELIKWLDSKPDFIHSVGDNKWVASMKNFIGNINSLSEEEKEFVYNNDTLAKIWCLFCNLQIDSRIFDDYGCVASMLHSSFMFDTPNTLVKTR